MQETYRSIGRLAAFTVLSAPFLFSLLVWSTVGLVETVAEAMVNAGVPNWCFLHQRVFPTGVCAGVGNPQSPPNTITLQPISHGQGRKNAGNPNQCPQNTPNSQRPSKCLKTTQTLKFEFDKKIRLLLI